MMYFFLYGQKQPIGWGKMKQHLFKMNIFTYQFLEKKQKSSIYLTKGVFLHFSWVFSKISKSVFAKRTGDFIFYMEFLKYQK